MDIFNTTDIFNVPLNNGSTQDTITNPSLTQRVDTELADITVNNSHNFTDNRQVQDKNKTIEETIFALSSGNDFNDDDSIDQNRQQEQKQQEQRQQQTNDDDDTMSAAEKTVDRLLKNRQPVNYLEKLDINAIAERIAKGDVTGLTDAINHGAENALRKTLASVVDMLPSISKSIEAQIMSQIESGKSNDSVWSDFTRINPAYAPFKGMIQDTLNKALKINKGNKNTAYGAVVKMFSGLVPPAKNIQQLGDNRQRPTSRFNIGNYLADSQ
jgi:hypothetical protein